MKDPKKYFLQTNFINVMLKFELYIIYFRTYYIARVM